MTAHPPPPPRRPSASASSETPVLSAWKKWAASSVAPSIGGASKQSIRDRLGPCGREHSLFPGYTNDKEQPEMNQSDSSPDPLVTHLQSQQHLYPHRPLYLALQHLEQLTGLCPRAAQQAISALSLDPHSKIGRLHR